jgi:hypothetical protein
MSSGRTMTLAGRFVGNTEIPMMPNLPSQHIP